MKPAFMLCALALVELGCAHVRTDVPVAKPTPRRAAVPKVVAPEEVVAAPPKMPLSDSGVPMSTSPNGMLRPDAAQAIARALIARGFLTYDDAKSEEVTARALREFQASKKLPRTGAPDRETLRKLDLDPDQILKQQELK